MIMNLKRKLLKYNKLLAWLLILSFIASMGTPVWSETDAPADGGSSSAESEPETEEEAKVIPYDIPVREEKEVLSRMNKVGESDSLELYVLEDYTYTGRNDVYKDFYLYDKEGKLVEYVDDMFLDDDGNNDVPLYDEKGGPILDENGKHRIEPFSIFRREIDIIAVRLAFVKYDDDYNVVSETTVHNEKGEPLDYTEDMFDSDAQVPVYDDKGQLLFTEPFEGSENGNFREVEETSVKLVYTDIVSTPVEKVKEEGMFAVRVKDTGYIWWSSPINAAHDQSASSALVDNMSSPVVFRAGNPTSYSASNFRSNTVREVREPGQPANYSFANFCERVEPIDGGAKFYYNFPDRKTKFAMEVVLDNDSIVVTIPSDSFVEEEITGDGSVMLALSLLNSFGAAPKGEDGYIVVPDGSGAVIEFDNGKTDAAQYAGQVYGRDYAVSQKYAPRTTQQVNLPVFGIVRDGGNNALVAIAEKGDENATIRAAVPGQGQKVTLQGTDNAIANSTSYNLAWFDFNMRTVDSFYIGTDFVELPIYETGYVKTGDIAVRYYPLSGKDLSYANVAGKYRDYLIEHKGVEPKTETKNLPMYMTINGGTVKTHSILGFPVKLQTAATTYEEAQEIINYMKDAGVDDAVITYKDFNTASVKREVSTSVQYSNMLGGKSGYKKLVDTVNQTGYTMYPSLGFMEFYKMGNGYAPLLNTSREVTRSRAIQQKYELAFGTPDPLQDTWAILSPYYFGDIFDKLIDSLKQEGISTISLKQAASMLYSDFSRKNPYGGIYFNRRDTEQILTEGFKKLNDAGISILAEAANAYALPYASHVSNVPMYSSDYDVFDYDVPFYPIVLQGLLPYSVKPFNESSNKDELTLLSLSTGTPIHYEFIYESPGEFDSSEYNSKFYADFRSWAGEAVENYKKFNGLIGDLAGKKILSHKRITPNEIETQFEGGKTVYVNLGTGEVQVSEGGGVNE
jgi:hypothetical protein